MIAALKLQKFKGSSCISVPACNAYNYQYEIYKKDNKYFGVMISEPPIIKTLTKKGNKYYKDNNSFGEYYTVEGSLKFYDKDGIITDYEGSAIE